MLNTYFNNFEHSGEQQLIEDLIIESIKIYGHDVYYLHRTAVQEDTILNEDDLAIYDAAYMLEMYIKNVEGFSGQGDFLSKFGVQIEDQITFVVSRLIFESEVGIEETISRPLEGDLIYFPLNGKVFEIDFVEHEEIFYQLGALQTWELRCSLYEYSGERFDTGIPELDTLFTANASQNVANAETWSDDDEFETEGDLILDFSEADPFSEGGRW